MDWDWISGLAGAGVMGAAWLARHWLESVQRAREGFQAERFHTYVSILETLLRGVKGTKRRGAVHEFRMAILRLNLMAPDEVARAAHALFEAYSDESERPLSIDEQVDTMTEKLGGLMLAIRRDLGNPATNLTDLDMMRVLVQDIGAYSRP